MTCRDGKCRCNIPPLRSAAIERMKELEAMAMAREKAIAKAQDDVRRAARMPSPRHPWRDAWEAARELFQWSWFFASKRLSIVGGMAWRMILKGLGKKRSK